jgi:hypothetical protein
MRKLTSAYTNKVFQQMTLAIPLFVSPTSNASFTGGGINVGNIIIGTPKCTTVQWSNLTPGSAVICGSSGCTTTYPEVTRAATFSSDIPSTISPNQVSNVSALASRSINYCISPTSGGNFNATLSAAVSPPYSNNSSDYTTISGKAVPAAVISEPAGSLLEFPFVYVNETSIKNFYVSNYTNSPVTITTVSSNITYFAANPSVIGTQINANGGTQLISVRFAPLVAGNYNGQIQINTSGGNVSYSYTGYSEVKPIVVVPPTSNKQVPALPPLAAAVLGLAIAGYAVFVMRKRRSARQVGCDI